MRLQSDKWSGGSGITLSGTSEDEDEKRKKGQRKESKKDQVVETEVARSQKAVQSDSAGKLGRSREIARMVDSKQ